VLALVGQASTRSSPRARLAPALPRERLAGPPAPSFSAGGRSKVVVFWASWCEPCAQEATALERFSQGASGQGRVIGVDWSDGISGARSFIRRHGWTFSNVRDAEGTIGNAYGLRGLPTMFVVDASGRIRATLRGPQDEAALARAVGAAGSI
jgi:cytochrome c biogenesis protein CcmG/thiol:disulfide interchange protein DsbE